MKFWKQRRSTATITTKYFFVNAHEDQLRCSRSSNYAFQHIYKSDIQFMNKIITCRALRHGRNFKNHRFVIFLKIAFTWKCSKDLAAKVDIFLVCKRKKKKKIVSKGQHIIGSKHKQTYKYYFIFISVRWSSFSGSCLKEKNEGKQNFNKI